jgi:hypothetical protein
MAPAVPTRQGKAEANARYGRRDPQPSFELGGCGPQLPRTETRRLRCVPSTAPAYTKTPPISIGGVSIMPQKGKQRKTSHNGHIPQSGHQADQTNRAEAAPLPGTPNDPSMSSREEG